jgi:hypothetical protein
VEEWSAGVMLLLQNFSCLNDMIRKVVQYAMCAVNPSRVPPTFSDVALCEVVDSIAARTASLLEIVNYNVEVVLY